MNSQVEKTEPVAYTTVAELAQVRSGYYGRMQDDANDLGWEIPLYSASSVEALKAKLDAVTAERDSLLNEVTSFRSSFQAQVTWKAERDALKAENAALLSRVERQAVAITALEEWAGILRASTGSVELPTGDDRDPSEIYADVRKKIDAALQETKL